MSLSPDDGHPSMVWKGTSPILSTTISSIWHNSDGLDAILQTPPPTLHRQDAMVNGNHLLFVASAAPEVANGFSTCH